MNLSCVDVQFCGIDDEQDEICDRTSSEPVEGISSFPERCLGY